ncbi:MAG: DUF3035 domain-containing protein [Paracoccaceae bacterium]|nr:DUF3035 domain-containing protein [Paracoccaceae bacterium]
MRIGSVQILTAFLSTVCLVATGCSDNVAKPGPNEFSVIPGKALSQPGDVPADVAALPTPTPGAPNRVSQAPQQDAIAALGGSPRTRDGAGIPARDQSLIEVVSRHGIDPGIRSELATADARLRAEHRPRILNRLFGTNVYFDIYENQSLDPYDERDRLRTAGIATPAAPPESERRRGLVFEN